MLKKTSGKSPQENLSKAMFFGGIHMDILGKCTAPAKTGASNPGVLSRMPGGSSLNCASVARQLGLECSIIGRIGDDRDGQIIQETLASREIGNFLQRDPVLSTGNYISIVNPDGELEIAFNDLQLNETISADWLSSHFNQEMRSHNIWVLNANLNEKTLIELSDRRNDARPKYLAAITVSESKAKRLRSCLENIDLLMTNIAEAKALVGEYTNPMHYIDALRELGVKSGSITRGKASVLIWDDEKILEFIPPVMENITDVIGAGDAFAGAVIAQLAQGKSLQQAVPIAIAAAQMILKTNGPWNNRLEITNLGKIANEVEHNNQAR